MSPSCQHVFFAIIVQNLMKLHLYVVQSCLVVFSLLKVIDGRKNVVNFANKTLIMLTSIRFVYIF